MINPIRTRGYIAPSSPTPHIQKLSFVLSNDLQNALSWRFETFGQKRKCKREFGSNRNCQPMIFHSIAQISLSLSLSLCLSLSSYLSLYLVIVSVSILLTATPMLPSLSNSQHHASLLHSLTFTNTGITCSCISSTLFGDPLDQGKPIPCWAIPQILINKIWHVV